MLINRYWILAYFLMFFYKATGLIQAENVIVIGTYKKTLWSDKHVQFVFVIGNVQCSCLWFVSTQATKDYAP